MPNHTTNKLVIENCNERTYEAIKELVRGPESYFDFNKIIPRPEILNTLVSGAKPFMFKVLEVLEDGTSCTYEEEEQHAPNVDLWQIENGSDDLGSVVWVKRTTCENTVEYTKYTKIDGTVRNEVFYELPSTTGTPFVVCEKRIVTVWVDDKKLGCDRPMNKQEKQELKNLGCNSWYDWSISNWGTKWNCYDVDTWDDEGRCIFFYTAWSPPIPVILKLSEKFPDVTFTLKYVDEGGDFVGETVFTEGYGEEYDETWNSEKGIMLRKELGRYDEDDDDDDDDDDWDVTAPVTKEEKQDDDEITPSTIEEALSVVLKSDNPTEKLIQMVTESITTGEFSSARDLIEAFELSDQ